MAEARRSSSAPGRRLVIMAREPRAGAVKTRLAREIGAAAALRFYRAATMNMLRRLSHDPRWRTVLAVAPDGAIASPVWPPGVVRMGQGSGDLGSRMQRVFSRLPPGPVVIAGTDIPEIRAAHIARAFALLGRHDAVFGPAEDGGYWLVGLRRSPRVRQIFAGVRWSSPHALAGTRANLGRASIALLKILEDVDERESHRRLAGAAARVVPPPRSKRLPRG
jgi:rSAM/selenodomain-associated transferase 1